MQIPSTPGSAHAPRGANRCRRRTRASGRCRLPVHDPLTGLCFRHARVRKTTDTAPDRDDLSADLFGSSAPAFDSPGEINRTLANLVTLVAQGRISSRRAAVLTYALSLILRGLQVMDKQAAEAPVDFIVDIPSAVMARHASTENPTPDSSVPCVPARAQEEMQSSIQDSAVNPRANLNQGLFNSPSNDFAKESGVHPLRTSLSSPNPGRIYRGT